MEARPTNKQAIPWVILLPVAALGGLVTGTLVGAVYLPYFCLREGILKIGRHWSYLDGWVEWAETAGRQPQAKRGWMWVWVVWVIAFFGSIATWAPAAGAIMGPVLAVWLVLAPDGWKRFTRAVERGRQAFQRFRVSVTLDKGSTLAS